MWLYGKAGCGKTVLASTIIEEILACPSDAVAVAYFYFDFNNAEKQNSDKMICSITYHAALRIRKEGMQTTENSIFPVQKWAAEARSR